MEILKTGTSRAGRPAIEGKRRQYVVADDVHEWIMAHGGGKYITETMRDVRVLSRAGCGASTDFAMYICRAVSDFGMDVNVCESYKDIGRKAQDIILSEVAEPEKFHVYHNGTWKDGAYFGENGFPAISSPTECPLELSERRYYRASERTGSEDFKAIAYSKVRQGDYCLVSRYLDSRAQVVGVLAKVEEIMLDNE